MDWDSLGTVLWQLGCAALAGGMIGIQRAFRGKVAGVRTHILICVGSALFMQISRALPGLSAPVPPGIQPGFAGDPARIASQVVVGCGFIGAGTIMRSGFSVAGITSAATIWVVAALGLAAGSGMYEVLAGGTAASLATLFLLGLLPVAALRSFVTFQITFRTEAVLARYRKDLEKRDLGYRFMGFQRAPDGSVGVDLLVRLQGARIQELELELLEDPDILRVSTSPHL